MEVQLSGGSRVTPFTSLYIFPLIIVTIFSCTPIVAKRIHGNDTDRIALLDFRAGIVDPLGVLDSWNSTIHFCRWYGVTCGRRHQRVTRLDLPSLKLDGIISPSIGNLSFLWALDLQNNSLHSRIPPEVGLLSRLRHFSLNNNSLEGPIPPSLSLCSDLLTVQISRNMLEGDLPANLSSLYKLEVLRSVGNSLAGSIPGSYGNLSSLEVLMVSRNNLDGPIPETLGNLQKLNALSLAGNHFVGAIPSSIFNISTIKVLDVGDNQLVGGLPPDLGFTLPALQILFLSMNQFTGPIPKSISNLSDLYSFQIVTNNFTGEVPSFQKMNGLSCVSLGFNHLGGQEADDLNFLCSLTNSTDLKILAVGANNFRGEIPQCISNLSMNLQMFSISDNMLSGVLPSSMGSFIHLEKFFIGRNHISGIIPSGIGYFTSLKILDLGENEFSGQIPDTIGNLSMLTLLSLPGNNLQGEIPSSLSKCRNLLLLDLSNNGLIGAIPPEIMGLSSLSIAADFSYNNLSGELPVEVGNLINLGNLALVENRFSGEIPSSLGSCIMLEGLYMQDNLFEGSIPSTLSSLRGIRELNLSNNKLSGPIPKFLGELNVTTLGLAFNEFVGALPTGGVFSNVSAVSVIGNKNLCGGLNEFQLPRCSTEETRRKGTSKTARVIIISSISGFLGLLFVLSLLYMGRRRKEKKIEDSEVPGNALLRVSYQSLLKATNGFSTGNLIGSGSFGSVFQGVLDWNQTVVAVKVLNLTRYGASKSFIAECEALRNIRHRNLVKTLTACSGTDYEGNDFKAIVYEFMVNGSLDGWLHPEVGMNNEMTEEVPKKLLLLERLNISIDVACALDYLHNQCETPMVHCDLKPSNILLDQAMTAHVGDFGLVRFLPESTRETTADPSSSIGIKGSFGYIAPEYGAGGEVSTHGDIYSFGILILEMFTGKRPTDEMFAAGLNLHSFAEAALSEQGSHVVDPFLLQQFQDDESNQKNARAMRHGSRLHKIRESLVSIIRLGVVCSSESPRDRKNIVDVLASLRGTQKELLRVVSRRD